MKLLDELRAEHELIESVVGSMATFAEAHRRGEVHRDALDGYLRFFDLFAGHFHHGREERVLFAALVRETEVPADRGPIAVMLAEHQAMATLLDAIVKASNAEKIAETIARYGTMLLHHIDAENSVLFPESEDRFRRTSVLELESRAPDDAELASRDEAKRLIALYPPSLIPGVDRGDGCVACSAYGVTCDGVEREWLTSLEWEDAIDRLSSG